MRRRYLFAVLLFVCQAPAWAGSPHDTAENAASAISVNKPAGERAAPTDPVIALIRSKLVAPSLRSTADPADLIALQEFYAKSNAAPGTVHNNQYPTSEAVPTNTTPQRVDPYPGT